MIVLRTLLLVFLLLHIGHLSSGQILNIDSNGYHLKAFYKGLGVATKWRNGYDIDWQTGISLSSHPVNHFTYCTRFLAAVCKRLNIHTQNPNDLKRGFGAATLYDWLNGADGQKAGWKLVEG